MSAEQVPAQKTDQRTRVIRQGGSSGAVYGLGLIGAWVYYFRHASTNQERVMAFLKGLVWPAYMVYALYVFLEKQ